MVHVIKVYLEDSKNEKQIRRVAVSSDVASNYKLLLEKIQSLFQLVNNGFEIKWKDSDNDFILMSSDGELAQALANTEEGLLRVYVYPKTEPQTEPKTTFVPKSNAEAHPLVICDACDKDVFGDRYKCLQCKNFDLCSLCNAANKHPDHDMIKLVKPAHIPREWVFWGARKIWRSMFGRCPSSFFAEFQEKKENDSPKKPEYPQDQTADFGAMPGLFSEFFKGDFVEASKLFTEGLGSIMKNLPGGIEVKLEQCPFKAECNMKSKDEVCKENQKPKAKDPECAAKDNATKQNEKAAEEKVEVQAQPQQKETKETILEPPQTATPNIDDSKLMNEELAKTNTKPEVSNDANRKSPTVDIEASTCPDGWTFLHEDETAKQEECVAEASNKGVTGPERVVKYPVLEEVRAKQDEGNTIQTNDPKIINALIKMQAMGFTNEGGWLERLLNTKQGNINEALDALYPLAQRH